MMTLSLALIRVLGWACVVRVECMRRIISIESLCIAALDYEPCICIFQHSSCCRTVQYLAQSTCIRKNVGDGPHKRHSHHHG